MKQIIYSFLILFLIVPSNVLCTDAYTTYADQWLQEHIVSQDGTLKISLQDFNELRTMLDLSAQRAYLTIATQDTAIQALQLIWQTWANITHTRLNPSHGYPYTIDIAHRDEVIQKFWRIADDQSAVCALYNVAAQNAVYGDKLETNNAKNALTQARAHARVCMLQSLAVARESLGQLYNLAFNKTDRACIEDMITKVKASLEDYTDENRLIGLSDITAFLSSYLPNLAVNTFIEADKLHNNISSEAWQAFMTLQQIGNTVWYAIETARAAHYQALIDALDSVA
jgi:hypothetical protein